MIAYEPVWAIGTGLTPTPTDVAEVHGFIRERLGRALRRRGAGVRILYGGSVKPANAKELLTVADVDGALVGGASLKADDFLANCRGLPLNPKGLAAPGGNAPRSCRDRREFLYERRGRPGGSPDRLRFDGFGSSTSSSSST